MLDRIKYTTYHSRTTIGESRTITNNGCGASAVAMIICPIWPRANRDFGYEWVSQI